MKTFKIIGVRSSLRTPSPSSLTVEGVTNSGQVSGSPGFEVKIFS